MNVESHINAKVVGRQFYNECKKFYCFYHNKFDINNKYDPSSIDYCNLNNSRVFKLYEKQITVDNDRYAKFDNLLDKNNKDGLEDKMSKLYQNTYNAYSDSLLKSILFNNSYNLDNLVSIISLRLIEYGIINPNINNNTTLRWHYFIKKEYDKYYNDCKYTKSISNDKEKDNIVNYVRRILYMAISVNPKDKDIIFNKLVYNFVNKCNIYYFIFDKDYGICLPDCGIVPYEGGFMIPINSKIILMLEYEKHNVTKKEIHKNDELFLSFYHCWMVYGGYKNINYKCIDKNFYSYSICPYKIELMKQPQLCKKYLMDNFLIK